MNNAQRFATSVKEGLDDLEDSKEAAAEDLSGEEILREYSWEMNTLLLLQDDPYFEVQRCLFL